MIRVGTLFSGIGTQEQALKNIGLPHQVIFHSDIDIHANAIYNHVHNTTQHNTTQLGDISKVDRLPQCDLLTYSFPCKSLSKAGNREGIKENSGTSSSLLWEVERLLKVAYTYNELPEYLLMENVPDLVGEKFLNLFLLFVYRLNDLGYTSEWKILNASDYGIPQNRKRVFMVSRLNVQLFDNFYFPPKQELKVKLIDLLENEVDKKYFVSQKMINYFTNVNESWDGIVCPMMEDALPDTAFTVTTKQGSYAESNYIKIPKEKFNKSHCYTITKGDIAKTITTGASSFENFIQVPKDKEYSNDFGVIDNDYYLRKLTPRESYKLMGWHDKEIDLILETRLNNKIISNTKHYSCAGNGIVIQVLEALFKELFRKEDL